jgi:hypothetical protein
MIHTTTGSRPEDGKPGYEYGAGTHLNPNVTWWDQCGPFLTYMARCQHLLRQGLFVADVLFYNGDWAPNLVPAKHTHPGLGKGYDYDVCNEEVLLTRLSVNDGRIALPDGMSYRILVLPDTEKMPVPVLQKLEKLVSEGAIVVGPKPSTDPGLKNHPACDDEVKQIAARLWGNINGEDVTENIYGKGRVYHGITPREVLQKIGTAPDVVVADDKAYIDFIHRTSEAAEIYFLLNRKRDAVTTDVTLRVQEGRPLLLNAVSGQAHKLADVAAGGTATKIRLEFQPREAYFVVFPKSKTVAVDKLASAFADYHTVQTLSGPWTVNFDPEWGGPESVEFADLIDWSKHSNPNIRDYSGSATYTTHFNAAEDASSPLYLDLGAVHVVADVMLNGIHLGTVWTAPWRIELPAGLKGENTLEIKVTNLWPNRLIADAALPEEQRLTRTNIEFKPDAPLLPSGLLGPVTLQRQE